MFGHAIERDICFLYSISIFAAVLALIAARAVIFALLKIPIRALHQVWEVLFVAATITASMQQTSPPPPASPQSYVFSEEELDRQLEKAAERMARRRGASAQHSAA